MEIVKYRFLWSRCEMKFAPSHLRSKYLTAKLFHLAKPNFTRRRRIPLKKEMPLIFSLTKSFSSAIWTFCDARIIEMDCNIYLIPFGFEFGFTFWTNVCFRYYNYIQDNKQDKYGNGYKIPRNIEMTAKPINLTGREHKS